LRERWGPSPDEGEKLLQRHYTQRLYLVEDTSDGFQAEILVEDRKPNKKSKQVMRGVKGLADDNEDYADARKEWRGFFPSPPSWAGERSEVFVRPGLKAADIKKKFRI
jgi:hypothetical protein